MNPLLPMATSTSSSKNLAALRQHGWGLLLTPDNPQQHGFDLYGIDNGAWSAYTKGLPWEASKERWQKLIEKQGNKALWAVAPDVVCGGLASLHTSLSWLPWLRERVPRVLIAVQDGMTNEDLRSWLSPTVGIFVGGSTEWKERTMSLWGRLARETGAWCHVGRVNTARRISLCVLAQVHSFDGTSASKFSKTVPPLTAACNRQRLPFMEVL